MSRKCATLSPVFCPKPISPRWQVSGLCGSVSANGKDTIFGENAADFRKERQFWHIDQCLDIDREIDGLRGEWELEGMPLQMSDLGVVVSAVPKRR
jgi:hypothetical protein